MVTQQTSSAPQATEVPPQQALWRMLTGCFLSQAIYVAAKLEIADLVKDGPKSAEELAALTDSHAGSLYRVLRALASAGIFVEDEQGRFSLTPLANLLRKDIPGSMHAAGLLIGSILQWPALGQMLYSVQSGESAFDYLFGMDMWEYNKHHPETHELFQYSMTSFSAGEQKAILEAYDFSPYETIVDIAGGQGRLLASILNAYPEKKGMLFELPNTAKEAEKIFQEAGVADRVQAVSGDMFEAIPSGGDIYMMKTVLHDWDDEQAVALLQSCKAALPEQGKLLLISRVIAPANVPDGSKFMDLNMMVTLGGRERTAAEIEKLLNEAGLTLSRIIPTRSPLSIVESTKE